MRQLWSFPRLATGGVVLLALAAALWSATYLPPGTMTSVALEAMAAVGCAILGITFLGVAAVNHYRS